MDLAQCPHIEQAPHGYKPFPHPSFNGRGVRPAIACVVHPFFCGPRHDEAQ
jgi:hypothetical protein